MPSDLKIVCDEQILGAERVLTSLGQRRKAVQLQLVATQAINRQRVKDADILIVRTETAVDEDLLQGSSVKAVASASSGLCHIDQAWLQEKGIILFDAKGFNADAVAQYTLVCILLLARELDLALSDIRLAIVGLGHIGQRLFKLAHSLEIATDACDPFVREQHLSPAAACAIASPSSGQWRQFNDLQTANIISFHTPLNAMLPHPTHHLICKDFLAKLPPRTGLINTARGGLHDSAELYRWAKAHPRQLCLDVYEDEPYFDQTILEPCLSATGHTAGYTLNAKRKVAFVLKKKLDAWWDEQVIEPDEQMCTEDLAIEPLGLPDHTDLLATLCHCIDPIGESLVLAKLLGQANSQTERGEAFSQYRKNYLRSPVARREFSHWLVSDDHRLRDTLLALGFTHKTHTC